MVGTFSTYILICTRKPLLAMHCTYATELGQAMHITPYTRKKQKQTLQHKELKQLLLQFSI